MTLQNNGDYDFKLKKWGKQRFVSPNKNYYLELA
jgi:hypothetical protein